MSLQPVLGNSPSLSMKNLAPSSGSSRRRRGEAQRRTMSEKKRALKSGGSKKREILIGWDFLINPRYQDDKKTLGKMSFQVFSDKDYKPEVPSHNPCCKITVGR